jgi:DNA-binding XRE family transcriptional regulator
MPPSARRHNLARIRDQLSLTQTELAKLVGYSHATIKAVETGKLPLSENLASRVSQALDFFDTAWLLKNDLDAPLPPILRPRSAQEDAFVAVVNELFSRLFAVVAKMDKHRARLMLELVVATELDDLRKELVPRPSGEPETITSPETIQYFIKNPGRFDPDLREWVNLEGLLKSNLRLFSERTPPQAENPSLKPPKSPSRTQGSPSPDGRRKKPKSS